MSIYKNNGNGVNNYSKNGNDVSICKENDRDMNSHKSKETTMGIGNKTKDNDGRPENDQLECQPSREGVGRKSCAGRLRRSRTCTCGRPRALARNGHHWQRLSACHHCLGIAVSASRPAGTTSHKENVDE